MTITVVCSCGTKLKAPDTYAGKKAKCNKCGAVLLIPAMQEPVVINATPPTPADIAPAPFQPMLHSDAGVSSSSTPETKKCPFCAEVINAEAKKCKYCGEFLDATGLSRSTATSAGSKIAQQTGPNEFILSVPLEEAFAKVATAFTRIGQVSDQKPLEGYVTGTVKYGMNNVKMKASICESGAGESRVVVQCGSRDGWGLAAKNGTRRLVDMLVNLDNKGYEPDQSGGYPVIVVAAVILTVILALGAAWYVVGKVVG